MRFFTFLQFLSSRVNFLEYVEQSKLWAALSFGCAVVGPLALLCCGKDRSHQGKRSAL